MRLRTVRLLSVALMLVLGAILAPAALADSVNLALASSTPEQGADTGVTISGSTGVTDALGDGAYLYALDRPADGTPCQASFGADQALEGTNSDVIEDGTSLDADSPFSEPDDFTPDVGAGIVCAWVETDPDDGDDVASASEVTAGPISASYTASGPQVGPIDVSVAGHPATGANYAITYTTSSDQDLTLDSIVIPAASGPCADSYEDQLDATPDAPDVLDGGADIDGPTVTPATDSETVAGRYLICSWIEGPDDLQVDATASTPVTVGTLTSASGRSGTGGVSGGTGHACVVPRVNGLTLASAERRLRAADCRVGTIHKVTTHRAKAGRVTATGAVPGRHLKGGATVGLTVAVGRSVREKSGRRPASSVART